MKTYRRAALMIGGMIGGGMVFGLLPLNEALLAFPFLMGMAVMSSGAATPDEEELDEEVYQYRNGTGGGSSAGGALPRIPLTSYLTFVPCVLAELVPAALHATIYEHSITFGKKWFIGHTALIGQLSQKIDPQLTVNSVFVLLLTTIVLIAPILMAIQLHRLGVMERGFKVLDNQPMGWMKLGTPIALYVFALAIESWTIYLRLQPEFTVFIRRSPIPNDPGTLIAVAAITFLFTTLIGYWTGTKIFHFQRDFGREG
ncbi:MAG: hypothetical protein NPIRA03_25650 [Nitrospirales bacterium]|nr:MAG: hypothetical protein NPIRA03_25650 [Nitrospirales bacterium]